MASDEDANLELLRQLRIAAQLLNAWVNQRWQPETGGLHPAGVAVLGDLAAHGESRPSALAKRRMVDVSVISRQIAQLTAAGLILRRPAPEDGRASLIRVSEAGEVLLKRWRQSLQEFLRDALHEWSEDELAELTSRLLAMNDALRTKLGRTGNTA